MNLTLDQKRILIAQACGWKPNGLCGPETIHHPTKCSCFDGIGCIIPDYFNDLNAIHEAEKSITYWPDYLFTMRSIVGPFPDAQSEWDDHWWAPVVSATASQRSEAFGLTLKLWEAAK